VNPHDRPFGSTVAPTVAIVHDYIAAFGGGERVVVSMAKAFPRATVYTSVYQRDRTFADFGHIPLRTTWLQRSRHFRHNHRHMLPFLGPTFSRLRPAADVTICSTTGWCHLASPSGRKVLYVHNTPRWLYQKDEYLANSSRSSRIALAAIHHPLRRTDVKGGRSADLILANSANVRDRIRKHWGCDAEVLHPPFRVDVNGPREPVAGVEPGYWLVIGRLVNYKNVEILLQAMSKRAEDRLVVLGRGPLRSTLEAQAPNNCTFIDSVSEQGLNWLLYSCRGLLAASHEDLGLTPIEAMAFGHPVVALRAGGYLETVIEGTTGCFFDRLDADSVAAAMCDAENHRWDEGAIMTHAQNFSEESFMARLRTAVERVAA
jgi:glycosyltransferase involved in cell wall biosynthesis